MNFLLRVKDTIIRHKYKSITIGILLFWTGRKLKGFYDTYKMIMSGNDETGMGGLGGFMNKFMQVEGDQSDPSFELVMERI